jgi:TonB family protein
MKISSGFRSRSGRIRPSFPVLVAAIFIAFTITSTAQQPQLSLADLLIGLRSKKVTIEERNTILAAAVRERGVTFAFTPEIEKELTVTGASRVLIDAVKEKSVVASVPKPASTPVPTPTPPDFNFYKTRADASYVQGEYTLALADYNKAVSLKADSPVAFLNRGRTFLNLKDYSRAGADFDKSIELDPKDSTAFLNRAALNEKLGEMEKAAADYQSAVDLDPANEEAKAALKNLRDQLQAKAAATQPPPALAAPAKAPESIDMGAIPATSAIRMAKPVYPTVAQKANIEGRVVVGVKLDEEGNVVEAKAVSGHQFLKNAAEDAARKSKFKPAMFGDKPVKGTGTITYNFNLRPGEE